MHIFLQQFHCRFLITLKIYTYTLLVKYYHIIMLSQSWKQLKLRKAKHKQLQMGQSIQEWIQVIQ